MSEHKKIRLDMRFSNIHTILHVSQLSLKSLIWKRDLFALASDPSVSENLHGEVKINTCVVVYVVESDFLIIEYATD